MKTIVRYIFNRLPKRLQIVSVSARGLIWRIQLKPFLKNRKHVIPRKHPISVVIPSFNDLNLLKKCLSSLSKTLMPSDEIIIVDDYCQDENTKKLLKLENKQVRVLLKKHRGGFAVTVNQGMREAKYDIVLLNSDVLALPLWSEYLQEAAYSHPDVGVVSAKLLYPDGRIQYGGTFWARSFAPQWFAHRFGGAKYDYPPSNVRRNNWGAGGACLYIKRAAYNLIGDLDETYWLGFEDVDYAMKAWEAGLSSIFEPNSMLFHLESATRGFHQGNRELLSMRTFWNKWGWMHSERVIESGKVRILISPQENELWKQFSEWLSSVMNASLIITENEVSEFDGISIIMSESVLDSAWIAHVRKGIGVALLRNIPKTADPRIASLQPEFDYILINETDRHKFERNVGLPVLETIYPCVLQDEHFDHAEQSFSLLIYVNENDNELAKEISKRYENTKIIEPREGISLSQAILKESPQILLNLAPWEDELEAFFALDHVPVLLSLHQDSLQYLLQNGLNSFSIEKTLISITERIDYFVDNQFEILQIRDNALRTLDKIRTTSGEKVRSAVSQALLQRSQSTRNCNS